MDGELECDRCFQTVLLAQVVVDGGDAVCLACAEVSVRRSVFFLSVVEK